MTCLLSFCGLVAYVDENKRPILRGEPPGKRNTNSFAAVSDVMRD